jgi:hypothetical protein
VPNLGLNIKRSLKREKNHTTQVQTKIMRNGGIV